MDGEDPRVLQSAAWHGVAEQDALHAGSFAIDASTVGQGMARSIGPDRAGNLVEVGVVAWHIAIVHAMRARPRSLR